MTTCPKCHEPCETIIDWRCDRNAEMQFAPDEPVWVSACCEREVSQTEPEEKSCSRKQ